MTKVSIVIINASLHGDSESSNTALLLRMAEKDLSHRNALVTMINPELVQFEFANGKSQSIHMLNTNNVLDSLNAADGLIVGTGTYWGQGSSTLQKFLEDATPSEGTDAWLGKPAGIIVSEHSSGGQSVLSNLVLTLSNFGCVIPPQGGMV
jgi:multimeric flavodoxin WrbA